MNESSLFTGNPEASMRPVVWICAACGKRNENTMDHCSNCKAKKSVAATSLGSQPMPEPQEPTLAGVFRVLGLLEFMGGVLLCYLLWPGEAGSGYQWRPLAYLPSLTWLMAGVIFGCLFLGVGQVLTYLCQIRDSLGSPKIEGASFTIEDNTRRSAEALQGILDSIRVDEAARKPKN
jgi:hypothetical protein